MHPRAHSPHPEQHHAHKSGFEEKGHQHFHVEHRPEHRSRAAGQPAPVGAKRELHHHAGDHAHRHVKGKDLAPVAPEAEPDLLFTPQPHPFQQHQELCQADSERRQHDMKADGKGELAARQPQRGFRAHVRRRWVCR